ncbi:MAG: FKBP-type peptidyl-prolyl cis-trans isomerase [Bacteroidales bacterium]|nr:FKBP-type peptidyl-prolyl cis-trans isomerase [Bacteroidales bacterium]MBO7763610.1 FKBP-type peptidyl-prolyl cis-trans isomerase [Bacteroidales bacterium]
MGTLLFSSCKFNAGDRIPGTTSAKVDSVSYALGAYFGGMIKSSDFGELNKCEIKKGLNDMMKGGEMDIPEEEIMQVIQSHLMKRMNAIAEMNAVEGESFLAKNGEKEGVVTLESGLQYKVIEEGAGVSPMAADTVEVHYTGKLLDGTVFDSSVERGEPAKFPLSGVIKGWSEGLTYAKEGGKIELYIPSNLGYGPRGYGNIPANSTLVFEVELLKVFPAQEK